MRKCKITFIAHGATIHSEEQRFSDIGKYPPLNESGTQEILKICEYLKNRGIKNDAIYSSPSIRCQQSAEYIAKLFKTNVITLPELYSRKYGEWNNMTLHKVLEKFPSFLDYALATPKDGESFEDIKKRVKGVISELVEKNQGRRIILVTTPEIIQAVIANALFIPEGYQTNILIKTGSATQISYFANWASLIYSDYVPL